MDAYETDWLDQLADVDWVANEFPDADVVDTCASSWAPWRHALVKAVLTLPADRFLTVAGPPLDRPFPEMPESDRLARERGQGRHWPTLAPEEIARDGYDRRLLPTVQIFRHGDDTLSATTPSAFDDGGWFPWAADEFEALTSSGWQTSPGPASGSPDLLFWFGPEATASPADEEERWRVAGELADNTVAVFQGALGLTDPDLIEVIQHR